MKSNNVSVVFGTSVMQRDTAIVLMSAIHDIMYYIVSEGGIDIKNMVVHTRANTVGSMMLGMPGYDSELDYKDHISVINIGVMESDIIEQGINTVYYDNIDKEYNMLFASWMDAKVLVHHKAIIPRMRNHEQESVIVNTEGRYCVMKKAISSSMMLESGSVNAAIVSLLLKDGKGYNGNVGGYYNKRINMLSYLYEAIDNDCDVLNVPAVHDYYLEGHSALLSSDKMVECSKMYTKSNSYSEF
jgi:NADH dehydrogenase/NADH:ubiquinone oxidoreductase subunit G